ncbi:HlyD family type I secretion periplasmic adaptor subunit [Bradyrhizobium diazoefficiens]|nr:HlyD family type I secretion periplasmic adaptor subunit [Bradyrhizobium diazoefficiens]QQO20312.1 HlyD family type I secretion periplasmic adaptor subunit [Bradyrhizobium diazoefficiens]
MSLSTTIEPTAAVRPLPSPVTAQPPISGLIKTAVVIFVVLLGGFGGWAAFAPLSSAAVAPGAVKVDSNRKTIQHLEGGIIREILVRDGDLVKTGQVLLRLDSLDADADRDAKRAKVDALTAQEARLIAERDNAASIQFPESLSSRRNDAAMREIMEGQTKIFADHRRALQDQVSVWTQRSEQYRAQMASLEAQNKSIEQQIPLFEEQLNDQKFLLTKGLSLKPKMLELERQLMAAKGEMGANKGKLQSLREQIGEAEAQIMSVRSTQAKAVSEELRKVQGDRNEAAEELRKFIAKAGRTDVVAPQDGTILNMKFFTKGGVVAPGGAILDLVPLQDKMVLEVKVQPLDIDVVRPDLPATVRFVAYKQRITPTVQGSVKWVAGDATTDEKTNTTYYLARVEVSTAELKQVPHVKLYPGMPVDVSIVTGQRTLLDYLIQPLTDSFAHAFRES